MTNVDGSVSSISSSFSDYWDRFVDFLPQLIAALILILIGIIVASILSALAKKITEFIENEKHVATFVKRWGIRVRAAKFVGMFVWWISFLVFLSAAVQILAIPVITDTINSLVAYAPQLFAAAVVAGLTLVAGRVVRSLVVAAIDGAGLRGSGFIGTAVYVAVLVFGFTLAAAQLGLDTSLVTANVTVVVGAFALAGALAFGLGARDVAGSIVSSWGTRGLVKKGQTITVDGVKGKITRVTHAGVVLDTSNGDMVVSHARLLKK